MLQTLEYLTEANHHHIQHDSAGTLVYWVILTNLCALGYDLKRVQMSTSLVLENITIWSFCRENIAILHVSLEGAGP